MSDKIVDMVSCSYCGEAWVSEDNELVCDKCITPVNIDLAVTELLTAIEELKKHSPNSLYSRLFHLENVRTDLARIVEEVKEIKNDQAE